MKYIVYCTTNLVNKKYIQEFIYVKLINLMGIQVAEYTNRVQVLTINQKQHFNMRFKNMALKILRE